MALGLQPIHQVERPRGSQPVRQAVAAQAVVVVVMAEHFHECIRQARVAGQ